MIDSAYISDNQSIKVSEGKYNDYIKKGDYKHSFEFEFPQKLDCEASVLSQIVFAKLLNIDILNINFTSRLEVEGIALSFDIMNNPNYNSRDFYCYGSRAERHKVSKLTEWREIKYTIGNFTVIPTPNDKTKHLQNIHKYNNECWDKLLCHIEKNWNSYQSRIFNSFEDYMVKTVQQIYYTDILNEVKIMKNEGGNLGAIGLDKVKEWNNRIKRENLQLINWGEKTIEKKDIASIVNDICLMIEVRGLIILNLLNNN